MMKKLLLGIAVALVVLACVSRPVPVHACDGCGDADAAIQGFGADLSAAQDNYNSAVSFMNNYTGPHTDQAYVDAAQASCDEADIMNADIAGIDFEVAYKQHMGCPM